jgi:hypothetical protein
MTLASRARIEAGAPSASWAGLVVLGDADVVPAPGWRWWPPTIRWIVSLTLLAILAILAVSGLRLRKARRV